MSESRALSRRDLGRLALALPAATLVGRSGPLGADTRQLARPSSVWGGVTIGVNAPYSFGNETADAEAILRALMQIGVSSVELRADMAEAFAGAPAGTGRRGGGGGGGGRGAAGGARGGGRGRAGAEPAAEQVAAQQAGAAALRDWRTSVPMDKFQALRKTYEDAGILIQAFRITLNATMSDAEYGYAFTAAKALGASQITMELPGDPNLTDRIGAFATKHEISVGYHLHTTANMTAWDTALSQSKFNAAQVDVGHYVAGTGESPVPLLRKHPTQIASLHLKDRKTLANGGENMSWGQGDTPIRDILQFMKREQHRYPAFIELEHMNQLPPGSSRTLEVYKCVEFCREALA